MKLAIEKALSPGLGFVQSAKQQSLRIGRYYSLMALKHDLIGISLTNSDAYVVPPSAGR